MSDLKQRIKDTISPPSTRELANRGKRDVRTHSRQIDRGTRDLQRDEAKIKAEIKKAAKSGNIQTTKILAKQIVQNRQHQNRQHQAKAQMQGIQGNLTVMQSQAALATQIGAGTKALSAMNKNIDMASTMKNMEKFSRENAKFEMTQEMMNDAMDDCFEGDADAEDDLVTQALMDVLGDDAAKLGLLPSVAAPSSSSKTGTDVTNAQLEKQLKELGIEM
jgi:charged multivesicular body protein 2A